MLTLLNRCRKAEAGPGTGDSEDPSEAGAWMKEWVYSPGTSLGLLLIPPTLPNKAWSQGASSKPAQDPIWGFF